MKKKVKYILVGILSLSMVLSMIGCGSAPSINNNTDPSTTSQNGNTTTSEEPIKVIWGNFGSSSMPPYFADTDAIAYIEEKSNGAFDFEYSPDGVLGGEADMIQQVMDGTIQAACIGTCTFSTYTNLMEVFQLPFLFDDYDMEYTAMTSDAARAIFDKVGNELGVKIVSIQENGMRHFANNIRPINTLEDLKGLKLRIVPSNMLTEVITNMGASPVSIAYADVYSALQNKVVDGEEINLTSIYAMKHYEVLDYVSLISMYPFPGVVIFNLDFFNSLTPEQQSLIEEGCMYGSDNLFSTYLPDYETEARAAIESAETQINIISDSERERFVEKAKPTWEQYREADPLIANFIDYVESLR